MKDILQSLGITEYGIIDFDKLNVINPRLLPKEADIKSTLVILMPYRHQGIEASDGLNAGLFARCKDYHGYFAELSARLIPKLEKATGGKAWGFADHSPIHEKDAAHKCGLGVIGKNGLLINERYGSYVFIGEFLLEKGVPQFIHGAGISCSECNNCVNACPVGAIENDGVVINRCLSFISQKSKKTEDDVALLAKHRTLWGCDICQKVCPRNKNASYSTIPYFRENVICEFTEELLEEMDEEIYKKYAFSYRKRKVILQNFLTAKGKYDIIT